MLTSSLQVLPFDSFAAERYGTIRAHLEKIGKLIAPMDLLIAAHASSMNWTLVTNNLKEFKRVPDLNLENWTS
jgi:tRNA(fMet)-specific endonuclease VapC